MSQAAPVDQPEISAAETAENTPGSAPLLPGQLTFGWGDEPEDRPSKKKDRKKKGKSGKGKRKAVAKDSSDDSASVTNQKSGRAKKASSDAKTAKVKRRKPPAKKRGKEARGTKSAKTTETVSQRDSEALADDRSISDTVATDSVIPTDSTQETVSEDTSATENSSRHSGRKQSGKTPTKLKSVKKKVVRKKRRPSRKSAPSKPESVAPAVSATNSAEAGSTADAQDSRSFALSDPLTESYADTVDYLPLKWGAKLPSVGFGFWKVEKEQTADICYEAIQVGYRHLDCACDYGNEVEVGQGIQRAISDGLVEREDLWVTSKLWNTYHAPQHVRMACEKSLNDLQLEYLDLYLIHFPLAQRFVPFETRYPPGWFFDPEAANPVVEEARVPVQETWQALEELTKEGLVRNIGICNFGTSQIRDLLTYAHIRPAVLQVETHPRLTQQKLLSYCQQEKIAYTAFSPLGAQSYYSLNMADPSESLLEHPDVTTIAEQVNRTAAQVLLRWGVQRGTAVIPKTSSKERMVENIRVFDFELSAEQMRQLDGLDEGRRFNDPGDFGEAAFNTFLPIYE